MVKAGDKQVIPLIDNLEDHMTDSLRCACPLSIWKDVYAKSLGYWMKDKELVGFPDFVRLPDIDQDITHNPCLEIKMRFKVGQVVKRADDDRLYIVDGISPDSEYILLRDKATWDSIGWQPIYDTEHAPGYHYGYDHNVPVPARIKDPTPMMDDEKTRMAKFFARSAHDR